jgi:hypothetical protein
LTPHLPPVVQNQRFVFMGAYISAILSARQRALADDSRDHPMWGSECSLEHFLQTLVALVDTPVDLPVAMLAGMKKGLGSLDPAGPVG